MNISFQYPWWLIIFCFLIGGAYAYFLYKNDSFFSSNTISSWYKRILSVLRFLSVSLLCILLLSPFLKTKKTTTYKPIVAVLQDNSESIKNSFKAKDSLAYFASLQKLMDNLSEKYEVVPYTMGEKLKPSSDFNLQEKTTNLSDAFSQINDLYYNQNLGAVIVATDGIYNQGINPVYAVASAPYQIYSIALGDTTIPKDLRIGNVLFNKITYLNEQFAVKAEVEATHLTGNSATLTIAEITETGARTISSKPFSINSENYFQSFDFIIPADKVGIAHYRLSLTTIQGEISFKNNVKDIFVEVLDGRQKILLLANSPHPDIAAIKSSIEGNKNYQLDVKYADEFSGKLTEYNLVILHQLPSATNKITTVLQQAKAEKKSLLFITGMQTSLPELANAQSALNISGNMNRSNDVTASWSKDFTLFTLSDATKQQIVKLPPLQNFFGQYKAGSASQILLNQRINSLETDFPLWLFSDGMDGKIGVIAAEGLWRWRLYNYLQAKSHLAFDELLGKTIQYLSVKSDKRPFRVNLAKSIFADNEQILFDAQLYNPNFELVNNTDVDLKIRNNDGKEYPFKMNKVENYFTLNAGFLPVGNYTYTASTKLGVNSFKADGKFSVAPIQLEEMRTVADHRIPFQLASQHGGAMYYAQNMEKITDDLLSKNKLKSILSESLITNAAINLKWLFILLLLLLGAEWFVRKYLGGY